MVSGQWIGQSLVSGGSVIGVVEPDALGKGWWAYGCAAEWKDTKIGLYKTEGGAKHRVERWVEFRDWVDY